jgi:hypothetical protein
MTVRKLRAVAAALLLGSATLAGTVVLTSAPAAAAVRAAVGKPLQDAIALLNQKNYKAAMAKVSEAEAVANKTPEETNTIAQVKNAIAINSGDTSTPQGAKAKFANDYNARKFKDVIADGDALKKNGVLDASSMQIIAQAYFESGDKAGCEKYIKNNFSSPGDTTLELLMRCAYDAGDDETQRNALETLVAHTGKPEYWSNLLKLTEHAQGMRDADTLSVYRLKLLTGTINGADGKETASNYFLLAQIALQLGFAPEAQAVITKGQASVKELNDARTNKLLELAKGQAAADVANLPKNLAAANAAPQGDALVKIAEDQWGQGKAKDAIGTAQAALKKPLTDKNHATIILGMAYLGAGQKADAVKTFDSVKGPAGDKNAMIAHLWSLYARR